MSNGAVMNYDIRGKNQWRRWALNRITERLAVKPENAVVLYLAGRDDYNRDAFLNSGFSEHNLIAVERDRKSVKALRAKGRITIHAELLDVITYWPDHFKIDVFHIDLCCGYTLETNTILDRLARIPAAADSVISFNMMRGRDSFSNGLRGHINKMEGTPSSYDIELCKRIGMQIDERAKHRGYLFVSTFRQAIVNHFFKDRVDDDAIYQEVWNRMNRGVKPDWCFPLWSYKSKSGQMFDSCVFAHPMRRLTANRTYDMRQGPSQKIIAAMAVRTRRINEFASN